jgi:cytochrome c
MIDRNNTIAGWVLAAGIVALGSSILFGKIFHGETPEKPGYAIAGEAVDSGKAALPLATLLASGDVAKGESLFAKCVACHSINAGGANAIGPNLHGTMGSAIAKHAGFAYSADLAAKGGTWTWENMDAWLTSPKKFAAGTKMSFAGIPDAQDRASMLLYLNTQGTNMPLPPPPAAGAAPVEGEAKAGEAAAPAGDAAKAGDAAPAAK